MSGFSLLSPLIATKLNSTGGPPEVSLHGGPKGFDDVEWEVVHPSQATLFNDEEKVSMSIMPSSVVFQHKSADGDQGFPGTLIAEVLVGLLQPSLASTLANTNTKNEFSLGSIVFVYRAKLLDEGKKVVTPVNLTQVGASGFHEQTIP